MLRYTLTRLLGAIPTLLLVVTLAFVLVRAAPGGPFAGERPLSQEVEANLRAVYRLDEPLYAQYWYYLSGVVRGDFGPSYVQRDRSVAEVIGEALPVSLRLGMMAMAFALIAGATAGVVAALRRNTPFDRALMTIAMTGISVPVIVIAPALVLVFAVKLQWLPASWTGTEGASRMILPVVALALPQVAYIARLTRASMIDVLSSDFIRTARAQGLGTANIVRWHALKPAMLPVLSYLGPAVAAVLTGSVVIEQVFGIPGLGLSFVQSASNRDYTVVLGIVILYATLIVLFNLVIDILYGVIDPRIRYR